MRCVRCKVITPPREIHFLEENGDGIPLCDICTKEAEDYYETIRYRHPNTWWEKLMDFVRRSYMFRLHCYCSNNGDGSASVHFCETAEQAEHDDENQSEPWGESSAESLDLAIKEGKICRRVKEWNPKTKKHKETWVPLEEVKE